MKSVGSSGGIILLITTWVSDMRAHAFRAVTVDATGLLDELVQRLEDLRAVYCVIGGQGVNAYVEPLVSLDLDIVIASTDVDRLLHSLPATVRFERCAHSINVSMTGSDLRVRLTTIPRYSAFSGRAETREVLGMSVRVAAIEDVLDGKVWAASDPTRRASKRQKDLADIARLIEHTPELRLGQFAP